MRSTSSFTANQITASWCAHLTSLPSSPDDPSQKQLAAAAQPLLGSPPIYTSTDPELFARFALPADSPPVILALKDNVGTSATSTYYPNPRTAASTDLDIPALQRWLLVNRLPTALELNTESFQKVMNAPKPPLVVLVGVASRSKDSTIDQIKELARAWRGSEVQAEYTEKEVVFVWMDATKWGSWMKSQYGIRQENLPAVVLVDHKVSGDASTPGMTDLRSVHLSSALGILGPGCEASTAYTYCKQRLLWYRRCP